LCIAVFPTPRYGFANGRAAAFRAVQRPFADVLGLGPAVQASWPKKGEGCRRCTCAMDQQHRKQKRARWAQNLIAREQAREAEEPFEYWRQMFFIRHTQRQAAMNPAGDSVCAGCHLQSRRLYQVAEHQPYCSQCWDNWWAGAGQAPTMSMLPEPRQLQEASGASSSHHGNTRSSGSGNTSVTSSSSGSSSGGQTATDDAAASSHPQQRGLTCETASAPIVIDLQSCD
jgi:hypothetical protein